VGGDPIANYHEDSCNNSEQIKEIPSPVLAARTFDSHGIPI
jgi:hypothetical protein